MLESAQIQEFRTRLETAKNVLVALPSRVNVDKLAAALSLSLALESLGKKVGVVSSDTIKVSHTNLFGVDKVKKELPTLGGGNLILTLENVVETQGEQAGSVPSLEKLDWYPEGANLNLVFHVLPGQTFEPTNIAHKYQGENYDLVITIGVNTLSDLGSIYEQHKELFDNAQIVNIDHVQNNTQYGAVNLVDPVAASISELMPQILKEIGFTLETDTATNLLTGIYDATHNLTAAVTADTFYALAETMKAGGKIPEQAPITAAPQPQPTPEVLETVKQPEPEKQWFTFPGMTPGQQATDNKPQPVTAPDPMPQQATQPEPANPAQPAPQPRDQRPDDRRGDRHRRSRHHRRDDRRDRQPRDTQYQPSQNQNPLAVQQTQPQNTPAQQSSSKEEAPKGEYVHSGSPEIPSSPTPDWLTPKVYRGGKVE